MSDTEDQNPFKSPEPVEAEGLPAARKRPWLLVGGAVVTAIGSAGVGLEIWKYPISVQVLVMGFLQFLPSTVLLYAAWLVVRRQVAKGERYFMLGAAGIPVIWVVSILINSTAG